jgi:hypothetical protein
MYKKRKTEQAEEQNGEADLNEYQAGNVNNSSSSSSTSSSSSSKNENKNKNKNKNNSKTNTNMNNNNYLNEDQDDDRSLNGEQEALLQNSLPNDDDLPNNVQEDGTIETDD